MSSPDPIVSGRPEAGAGMSGAAADRPHPPGFRIDPERRLVVVVVGEMLTVDKLKNYATALRADPSFDPDFSELVDLRGVEEITITPENAMALADEIDPFSTGAKRAFVTSTNLQMHAARMHQLLRTDKSQIKIFSSLADAKRWIASEVE